MLQSEWALVKGKGFEKELKWELSMESGLV